MIAEGLKYLTELAKRGFATEIVTPCAEPEHIYFMRDDPDGPLIEHVAEPWPRTYVLFTLDDMVSALKLLVVELRALVFCGRGRIEAILDEDGARLERLTIKMALSHEFETLKCCADDRQGLTQRAFINLLRVDLPLCVDPQLFSAFRMLRFRKTDAGHHELQPGRESLGRQLNQEIAQGGEKDQLPSEVLLPVTVYRDAIEDYQVRVRAAIDVNIEEARFRLIPLAGELERAQAETDEWIKGQLVEKLKGLPIEVLAGRPREAVVRE